MSDEFREFQEMETERDLLGEIMVKLAEKELES